MRQVILLCALVASSAAGTRVVDTMRYADGRTASGWLMISWPAFSVNGTAYAAGTRRHQVVAGVLDVDLVPVDAAVPAGTLYTVRVTMENAPTATEYWYIPTTPTTVTLATARVTSPTIDTDISTIAALNCSNGEIIKRASGAWACGADAGGVTAASNLGGGTGWYKQLNGSTLEFRTVAGTSPVTLSLASDVVTVACPTCEVTTARGAASGYAPLDASVLLPLANLPTVTPAKGGTGSTLTATAGRYLRGDGSVFGLSGVAAAGAGACSANQYVTAGNDNAPPTCSQVGYGQLSGTPSTFAPAAHAASHQNGGGDEVATATPGNNAIPKATGTGTLAAGWLLGAAAGTELPIDGFILVRSGGTVKSAYYGPLLQFSSDHGLQWKDSTNVQSGTVDTQLYRTGTSILKLGDGAAGTGTLVANLSGTASTATQLQTTPVGGDGIVITGTSALNISTDGATVSNYTTGAGAPSANCTAGRTFYLDTTNTRLYRCSATNTWMELARISSGSGAPASGACDAAAEVGTLYYRTDNTSGVTAFYGCSQTGGGAYGWTLFQPVGTASEITVTNGVAAIADAFDISGHTSTAPNKKGTSLPGTCSVGMTYQKTDATAASQFYLCTSTNTWTAQGGSGGVADPGGNGVMVRTSPNTTTNRTVTGTSNEITVTNGDGVSGNPILALASTFDISGKTSTKPSKAGTSPPGTCAAGETFIDTDANASSQFLVCTSTNTWTAQGGGSGLPSMTGNGNKVLSTDGSAADWRTLGFGLANDGTQITVDSATIPTLHSANTFSGTNTFSGIHQVTGGGSSVNYTGANTTRPVKTGTALPGTCVANEELFLKTNAPAGQQLYQCNGAGTNWNLVGAVTTALDPTSVVPQLYDEFMVGPGAVASTASSLGWVRTGASADVNGEANHPGVISLDSTASANSTASIKLAPNTSKPLPRLDQLVFDSYWIVKPSASTSAIFRAGYGGNGGSTAAFGNDRISIDFDTSLSDTNWMYVTCNGGTCTRTSSGVAVSGGTWYKLRIRCTTAGTILFSINAGSETGQTTNLPTSVQSPGFYVETLTTAVKSLAVDYFGFQATVTR